MKNLRINVGDYVRTKDGRIFKWNKLCTIDKKDYEEHTRKILFVKNEIKSSPNIIDLIEVGDYVNGEEVNFADVIETWGNEKYCWTETGSISSESIYSIVTKEQFEAMEYKVEK